MKALSFELSGKTGCFRKPDVNAYAYFTYNNIHKPALLGLLGAVIGLGGYTQRYTQLYNQNKRIEEKNKAIKKKADKKPLNNGLPEFYEKLEHLKVSIAPIANDRNAGSVNTGYFSKKIQTFNNSVGYASKEVGGNLIVREQWLENPKWQIMVLNDGSDAYQKIVEYLINKKAVYIPYLGKNDHPAKIDEDKIKEIELKEAIENQKVSSLFIEEKCEIANHPPRNELSAYFREVSPMRLQQEYHFYEYENLVFTNHKVIAFHWQDIYAYEGENYFFM